MAEPTFHIVGPANSLEFAQMEYLGETLMRNLPNISCRIVRVHPSDWPDYAVKVCRVQGFPSELAKRLVPFAWTGAGYLVGDAHEFNADVRAANARSALVSNHATGFSHAHHVRAIPPAPCAF